MTSTVDLDEPSADALERAARPAGFRADRRWRFRPGIRRGAAAHEAEIEAIAGNAEPPTIENTLAALELAGDALDRVSSIFWCRAGAHTNDAIQALERDISPKMSRHFSAISMNEKLFARIDDLHAQPRHARPRRRDAAGAGKDLEGFRQVRREARRRGKKRLAAINEELCLARHQFGQNVLADEKELGAVPRRGRPCRPARLPARRDGAGRRKPRPQGQLCRHPVALDLRALHDLFRPPRPARAGLPRLHRPRRERRRDRQCRGREADAGAARREGQARSATPAMPR